MRDLTDKTLNTWLPIEQLKFDEGEMVAAGKRILIYGYDIKDADQKLKIRSLVSIHQNTRDGPIQYLCLSIRHGVYRDVIPLQYMEIAPPK